MDDGRLHAYLDEEISADEVARLREHVASCAECRARLDLARETRTRAHQILRMADPPTIVTPDFATVLARGKGVTAPPAPAPAGFRPLLLPWAASLVLALGAGWFAQQLIRGSERDARVAASESPAVGGAEASDAPQAPRTLASGADQERATDMSAERAPGEEPVALGYGAGAETRSAPGVAEEEASQKAASNVASPPPPPATPAPTSTARPDVSNQATTQPETARSLATRARGAAVRELAEVSLEAVVQPESAGLSGTGSAGGAALARDSDDADWPQRWVPITAEAARTILGAEAVTVPGLPVEGYRVGDGAQVAVLVLQRLPGGELLQLLQRRPAAGEGSVAVEMRASIPPDSLRRLLEATPGIQERN